MNRQKGHFALSATLWVLALVTCTMALIAYGDMSSARTELRLMQQERADLVNTPLFETSSVSLPADLVARYKAAGIRQLNVEPIGTSRASYFVVVNGQPVENSYSTVHSPELMYRVDLSGSVPRVWVTESVQRNYEPRLVGFVLEREMKEFLAGQAAKELLKKQWSEPPRTV